MYCWCAVGGLGRIHSPVQKVLFHRVAGAANSTVTDWIGAVYVTLKAKPSLGPCCALWWLGRYAAPGCRRVSGGIAMAKLCSQLHW